MPGSAYYCITGEHACYILQKRAGGRELQTFCKLKKNANNGEGSSIP
jgi:hypothetical protein